MIDIILKFFLYSVLGNVLEVVWNIIINKQIKSRRMLLNLPMCPVYGFGGVAMSALMTGFCDNPLIVFSVGALLASAVELLYYLLCLAVFGVRVWDYSENRANLMGGVCGEYTLWWGLLSVAVMLILDPIVSDIISDISSYGKTISVVFLSFVTFVDVKETCKLLYGYKIGKVAQLPDCFWYMKNYD
ncbi:MAG: putative ABC transporter permease [Eubacteriales bacterium]|nr:putative ABC transporter permease [Eubacteriales bacterium]